MFQIEKIICKTTLRIMYRNIRTSVPANSFLIMLQTLKASDRAQERNQNKSDIDSYDNASETTTCECEVRAAKIETHRRKGKLVCRRKENK
ncbi:hypothetical protein GYH30_053358 [Glycine max]|uniref:Uncharacterized protein n=1 Tax=Glycine max TaxID=3847 RepID=A0A0R0EX56_SOYBN|nr:hypothetical protein GYH30_053358 [Glycine max]